MRGWPAVAGLGSLAAAVTALWVCWRLRKLRKLGGTGRLSLRAVRHRPRGTGVMLLTGLAIVWLGGNLAARNPTVFDQVVGLIFVVVGVVFVTLVVGGLLIERR